MPYYCQLCKPEREFAYPGNAHKHVLKDHPDHEPNAHFYGQLLSRDGPLMSEWARGRMRCEFCGLEDSD